MPTKLSAYPAYFCEEIGTSFPTFLLRRFLSCGEIYPHSQRVDWRIARRVLGRRGYDVDLYERRTDPREGNIVGGGFNQTRALTVS